MQVFEVPANSGNSAARGGVADLRPQRLIFHTVLVLMPFSGVDSKQNAWGDTDHVVSNSLTRAMLHFNDVAPMDRVLRISNIPDTVTSYLLTILFNQYAVTRIFLSSELGEKEITETSLSHHFESETLFPHDSDDLFCRSTTSFFYILGARISPCKYLSDFYIYSRIRFQGFRLLRVDGDQKQVYYAEYSSEAEAMSAMNGLQHFKITQGVSILIQFARDPMF